MPLLKAANPYEEVCAIMEEAANSKVDSVLIDVLKSMKAYNQTTEIKSVNAEKKQPVRRHGTANRVAYWHAGKSTKRYFKY